MDDKERIDNLKRYVFYELLDMAGRVMVLVKYSPDVVIGNRGFIGDEKETGIVLVFNPKMKFNWDEFGITATLVFGAAPQKCFIPADCVAAVYSPEMNMQFVTSGQERPAAKGSVGSVEGGPRLKSAKGEPDGNSDPDSGKKIISVDFVKKKLIRDEIL
ncbi:MAG TPA: hypothetical protein VK448_05310 [Dissulfurispiraceae bacterium]|nr:hypothetical protein [Dissulfurispiraceae bacterium]